MVGCSTERREREGGRGDKRRGGGSRSDGVGGRKREIEARNGEEVLKKKWSKTEERESSGSCLFSSCKNNEICRSEL